MVALPPPPEMFLQTIITVKFDEGTLMLDVYIAGVKRKSKAGNELIS